MSQPGLLQPAQAITVQPATEAATRRPPDGKSLVVRTVQGGLEVSLHTGSQDWSDWPRVQVGSIETPGSLIPVEITDPAGFRITVQRLKTNPLKTRVAQPRQVTIPQQIDGIPRPDLAPTASFHAPTTPLHVLRRGRMRGREFAVLAVTPVFQNAGEQAATETLQATVHGVKLLDSAAGLAADHPVPLSLGQVAKPSPYSQQAGLRLIVSEAGIQRISYEDTSAAGLSRPATGESFQLYHKGVRIPLNETQAGLTFYAKTPGDRWNRADSYWLTVGVGPAMPMESHPALDASVPVSGVVRTTAWEPGESYTPQFYDSTLAGADGDHFFVADLRAGPGLAPITHTVQLASVLPLAPGSMTLTVLGTAYTENDHTLAIFDSAGQEIGRQSWSGVGNQELAYQLPRFSAEIALGLVPGLQPDGVEIDRVSWLAPVNLAFGGAGGSFITDRTPARYRLTGLPAAFGLYDVTDPARPIRLDPGASSEEGLLLDSPGMRHYFVADERHRIHLPIINAPIIKEGTQPRTLQHADTATPRALTMHRPGMVSVQPADWSAAEEAAVLYIAPGRFHEPLTPLIQAREAAGYQVALVDVQTIYDGWTDGMISPAAIRAFLRYVASTGSRAPLSVTLVGDGTSDPRNYTGRNNETLVPPFLAEVDPWLRETACDACYGQLDGVSPLDDPLPDVWIGRIPAKSIQEVSETVAKILAYESRSADAFQQARSVYITDNFQDADGRVDGAGDFAQSAEASIAIQPTGMAIERVYYDPSPTQTLAPWREPNAVTAYRKTLAALQAGGGFVNYMGHAHNWQWASTDLNADPPYLLGLFDIDLLQNAENLPILLEMTCLTGAFQTPAFSGTVVDERWILNPAGGAAAVWGPTGLGVAYGHDQLQRGFYNQFWGSTGDKRLGALTSAGFLELFTEGLCCQEALRTYVLFGDPLTTPQVQPLFQARFPLVAK